MDIKKQILMCISAIIVFIICSIFIIKKHTNKHYVNYKTNSASVINIVNERYKMVVNRMKIVYGNDGKYIKNIHILKQPYKISKNCIELIKKWESCSLTSYHYSGNKVETRATIGWGHVIYEGDNTPNKITQAQADDLLVNDLNYIFVPAANKLINDVNSKFKVTQGFFDGFVSLLYNCGITGIQKSAFWKRLKLCRFDCNGNINKYDYEYMLAAIKTTRVSEKGHINRRSEEYKLMRSKNDKQN